MKRAIYGMVFLIVIGAFVAGCTTALPTGQGMTNDNNSRRDSVMNNEELSELIKTFSEDRGPKGEEAFAKLQAYPAPELIGRLVDLERTVGPSDKLRPQIAFLFCWLEHDYESNVKLIESALSKTSPYQGFYADDAESMLSRLIDHGKKDLLKPLFESTTWADGALSEGLSVTFARGLQNDPEHFLSQLSPYPKTREKSLLADPIVDSFTESASSNLRRRLSSIPKTPTAYEPAKELLRSLSSKASK